ncbi:MAG TPA: PHP domain-containing protein [Chloroflexota bacterium]|nr:PHP domain-containing protein [Chloroflexota bacterium]
MAEGWGVDLHAHSRHSDGVWTPRELVDEAGRRGVRVLALTDHDAVGGQAEVVGAAARAGLLAITGVEITTCLGDRVYHLLCYDLDPSDPVWTEIERRRWTTRQPLPVEELARLLPDGAGLLSVAHPGREERGVSHRLSEPDLAALEALLPLVALEAQHPYHAPLDIEYYRRLAADHGLAVTCGSDAHGWRGRRMPIAHPTELARGFLELVLARWAALPPLPRPEPASRRTGEPAMG